MTTATPMDDPTLAYYEDQAETFFAETVDVGLLHVPMAELPDVLGRLGRALKPEGVLYASFKYGAGEREHGGRRFTDLDEEGLAALVGAVPVLAVIETWVSGDRREGREGERWLNVLLGVCIEP